MIKKTKSPVTTTTVTRKTTKTTAPGLQVSIDYPQQDEGISSENYTFRFGSTPWAEKMEVSIDRGPWLTCRSAEGYWWYDWSNYTPGVHRLTVRAVSSDGTVTVSSQRRFQVLEPHLSYSKSNN